MRVAAMPFACWRGSCRISVTLCCRLRAQRPIDHRPKAFSIQTASSCHTRWRSGSRVRARDGTQAPSLPRNWRPRLSFSSSPLALGPQHVCAACVMHACWHKRMLAWRSLPSGRHASALTHSHRTRAAHSQSHPGVTQEMVFPSRPPILFACIFWLCNLATHCIARSIPASIPPRSLTVRPLNKPPPSPPPPTPATAYAKQVSHPTGSAPLLSPMPTAAPEHHQDSRDAFREVHNGTPQDRVLTPPLPPAPPCGRARAPRLLACCKPRPAAARAPRFGRLP